MRERLLGFLLGALEPSEHQEVETCLAQDSALRSELEVLRRGLAPLAADSEEPLPPLGLARRTCSYVAARDATSGGGWFAGARDWRLGDMLVAAGIVIAASLLLFSGVDNSRRTAARAGCQWNLSRIFAGLQQYSLLHKGYLPTVPESGPLAVAGMYAPALHDMKFVTEPRVVVCPSSNLAEESKFRIPSRQEVLRAPRVMLVMFQRSMGGSYAYDMGYCDKNGRYCGRKLNGPVTIAILADAPCDRLAEHQSANHGGCGQNVLMSNGQVQFLTMCRLAPARDHIYQNALGQVAAGTEPGDSVLGPSHASPFAPLTVDNQ